MVGAITRKTHQKTVLCRTLHRFNRESVDRENGRTDQMTQDIETAREDLAFIRDLVESGEQPNSTLGLTLLAAGIIFGVQTLVQWAEAAEIIQLPGSLYLAMVVGFSLLFVAILSIVIWRDRKTGPKTAIGRASEAAFQATGLANLCLVAIFLSVSIRQSNPEVWYLYAPVVFALQGGAWFVAARLRRRFWLAAVALGWFVAAIAMALTANTHTYILIASTALFTLMALPGWVMMRVAKKAELD
jgi:hypothetical protein